MTNASFFNTLFVKCKQQITLFLLLLQAVATSRLECLEGVSKVAGLEDLVNVSGSIYNSI